MVTRHMFQENLWDPTWLGQLRVKSEELMDTLDESTDKLVEALDRNSKSSSFLAWVGIGITIMWAIATGVWARYTYLSYIK